ncbi:decaprenylphospho-beta-D-erythro-pentofuranosid-2-ulose 2-reductase [Actinocrispum sp. NPDC049592]|uniref:decaprenylphospho-beta-D-erythro-pentofuranosid- 2-ulose 2-reductase n=1 Tax=Actinocrispum sp. NPDC049592 TaxID=3154835 RepID=UPI00342692A4
MIDAVGSPQSLLVLGGTSEIGLAVAARYARQKPLRVVLAARPSPRLDAAVDQLRALGATVSTVPFDARKPDTHEEVIEKAFADGDIDVTVVAFGVLGDQEEAWTNIDVARELAEVNYVAAVTVGVPLAERLRKQGHGSLVAISSAAGERARRSNFVYGSTKAGFDAFYTGLTYALKPHGITVSVIRPGFVKSKMTEGLKQAPLAQTPDQVADIIVSTVRNRREQAWAPAAFRPVMTVLRHVPRVIFRRLPF